GPQQQGEHSKLEDVGVIAGMKGVSIAQHESTRGRRTKVEIIVCPYAPAAPRHAVRRLAESAPGV
ncbi:MAG: hypothetical protein AB7I32_11865, partial [Gammaproteobacteria bacterium]